MTLAQVIEQFLDLYEGDWSPSYRGIMDTAITNMLDHFGERTRMRDIAKAKITSAVAAGKKRTTRKRVGGKSKLVPVSNAYVNRYYVQPMRRVWIFAKEELDIDLKMPKWKKLMLSEPKKRDVRLTPEDETKLLDKLGKDMAVLAIFAMVTGVRRENAVGLKWDDIDWEMRAITVTGKGRHASGRKELTIYITEAVERLLRAQEGHDDEYVFTYICERSDKLQDRVKGQRYPMSVTVLRERWKRARNQVPGLEAFRWHDLRHVFGTRTTQMHGKDVTQVLMHHEDGATTERYVHPEEAHIRGAMEQASARYLGTIEDQLAR